MRILIVTDWHQYQGGVEQYVRWLRDDLRKRGDDARLLTSSAGSAADGSADYVAYGTRSPVHQALLQIVNPAAALRVAAAVRDFRPDVAHVHMFEAHLSPAILPALGPTPIVLSIADYKSVCPTNTRLLPDRTICEVAAGFACVRHGCISTPHWLRNKPRYALIRRWPKEVRRVLACSATIQRCLSEHGVRADRLLLPARLPPAKFERRPSASPTFFYCGRLAREKGVDLLLRASARLRKSSHEAHLVIAGDGPLARPLRVLADSLSLGSMVTWRGWLTPDDMESDFSQAWALVAPSLWAEPFGLVAVEAITRGVPVIASSIGGFAETVEPGVHGLLFPNDDEDALTACLSSIATGAAFRSRVLTAAAIERVTKRHSPTTHTEELRRTYQAAIEGVPLSAELAVES